ncbi:MAG: signal peptidase II [Clostridia bacterium]|nr:signal peptidase II [Clostridia bacterium]
MLIAFIICAVVIILDQVTKFCLYGMSCSLIGDFLWIESTLNTGASFGMLKNGTLFFIIFSIPMIAIMIWLIISKKHDYGKFFKITIGILLGGTIGNLIDRIFFAGVRDFIYFKSINFAIFNVADIAITVATIMLVVYLFVEMFKKKEGKEEAEK